MVFFLARLQGVLRLDVGHRIALADSVGDGVAENLPAGLQGTFCDVQRATFFNGADNGEQARRGYFINGLTAQRRENIDFKSA